MRDRVKRVARWGTERRASLMRLAVRALSFYVGYRILHHEIYETDTSEPLLIFLGLWLCGLPPALFFEDLRKLGQDTRAELERQSTDTVPRAQSPESGDGPEGTRGP